MTNVQPTSLLAYFNDVLPKLGEKQREVLEALLKHEDATNMELANDLRFSVNCITPRIFELREKKLVVESRKRKCKVTNKMVIAWKINQFAKIDNSHLKPEVKELIKQRVAQPSMI